MQIMKLMLNESYDGTIINENNKGLQENSLE